MDDLIEDAKNKGLISFEIRPRWLTLERIIKNMKNMAKLPEIELEIYWHNYILLHGDTVGFVNDDYEED
jgi:hypothetical protein